MPVFPKGGEFEIVTTDHANPRIAIKRLFTCAHCQRFVTTAAWEDDIGVVARGHLHEPNNYEYQCGSKAEYRELLETTDAIGSTVGRQDPGFVRLDPATQPAWASPLNHPPQSDDEQARASYVLGNINYMNGDRATARSLFLDAAGRGHAAAMKNLGLLAEQDGDPTTALDWFQRAADHGDDAAMHALGNVAYSNGERATARMWFRRAADLGNAAAMNGLGWLADEDGDRTTALTWYSRAADHGDDAAMYALGGMALKVGDRATAITWLRRAADLGSPEASEALRQVELDSAAVAAATHAAADGIHAPDRSQTVPRTTDRVSPSPPRRAPKSGSSKSGGCYVATAVYGSYDCPEVWVLRRFRDQSLARSFTGRVGIRVYYAISPVMLRVAGRGGGPVFRGPVQRFVGVLRSRGYSDDPYEDPIATR